MQVAVSTLITFRKEHSSLPETIMANLSIVNWEVIDEGFHKLNTANIKALKEIASTGEVRYSIHAPFSSINLAEPDSALRNMFVRFMEKSLKRAYELEARIWVLHPGRLTPFTYSFPEKAWEANNNSLLMLSKEAKDLGIQIVVENMPGRYELFSNLKNGRKLLEDVKTENVGLCFDIGHANLRGETNPFLSNFSNEILHIHVHDNLGEEDSHLALGKGNIEWEKFLASLEKSKYGGWVVFENYELCDVREGIEFLASFQRVFKFRN